MGEENVAPIGIQSLACPACGKMLYQLCYPGIYIYIYTHTHTRARAHARTCTHTRTRICVCVHLSLLVPVAAQSKCGSVATRLLRLWLWIPLGNGYLLWVLCVLSARGLCDKLITCPEESYQLWCIIVCDLETLWMGNPWPTWGLLCHIQTKTFVIIHFVINS
jgi:hypothetical protein